MGPIGVGVLMGIGGTLSMDFWAKLMNQFAGQPLPNWAMPGRWFGHVFRGKVFHDAIADAEEVPGELALGWGLHYGVGILYGVLFAVVAGPGWLAAPTFYPIWVYAMVTIAAGWFLLQPGMGMGWAGAGTPNPPKIRALGLLAHSVFGAGMWAVAVGMA